MMSISIRRYRVRSSAAAASRRIEQEIVPLVSRVPEFYAFYVLDPGDGMLVTVWLVSGRIAAEDSSPGTDLVARTLAPDVALAEITTGEVTVRVGI